MYRKLTLFLAAAVLATAAWAASRATYNDTYARDRAEIEDLLARYAFALDWQDATTYAGAFTEDGQLVWAGGTVTGRKAIEEEIRNARAADQKLNEATPALGPIKRRHFIPNIVLQVDGDRATARSMWFEFNNDNGRRQPYLGAYGHLEDDLRRVDGRWLIARHKVINEQRPNMASGANNPAW